MNFYNISQIPERQQTAQHFHSSIEQPNLENVQAQLYAARQKNYQMSKQYFQNKYGNGELFNSYVQKNGLSGLGAPEQPVYDFKRELNKKAIQIQEDQMRKINSRKKGAENSSDYDSQNYKRKKERQNIWDKPKRNEVKIQQQEYVQAQPYEVNIVQETQKAFMSEFKNYLSNKNKIKEEQQESKLQLNRSVNSQFKDSNLSQAPQKKTDNKQKCYEQELIKKIFKDLTGKADRHTQVEKINFISYINSSNKMLRVLGTTPEEVSTSVMTLECKDANLINMSEGLIWIFKTIGKIDQAKKLKAEQQFEEVPGGCMLPKQIMQLFEDTFRAMDRHNDLIIKRVPFVGRLTSEPLVKKNLNSPAVFQPEYNRHVSLRRIFERIQIETLLCSQEQQKVNEYISWNQFIQYFQSGHKQRGKYDLIVLVQSLKNEQKFGFSHLAESLSQIISESFKKLDRGEQMFNTTQLLNEIKLHPDYDIEKYTFIKQTGSDGEGTSETFEDVLARIKEKGLKFVNPKEFLEYFSERGRPIEQFQAERKLQQSKNFSPTKVSFVENEMFPKEEAPNGYDSDPELYNNSQIQDLPVEVRKSQKQFKRFKQTSKSFLEPDSKINLNKEDIRDIVKVTVPQPFAFEQREREKKLSRSQQKNIQTIPEYKQFKAEGIPAKVAQIGLYQRIMTEQQKRNEDRKRSSMIMTLANEKPFSFESRKTNKKTKQERQNFVFKAKPIPWYCSIDLLAKKKEEQIIRKERIAKTAQENLTKAKLPPRMEKDNLQKEANKALSPDKKGRQTQSVMKVRDPPDFSKIHKNFQEAMERKRKQNKNTEIKEFKFYSTSKDNISKVKAEQQKQQHLKKSKCGVPPSSLKSNIDIFAQSTAKFSQQVDRRRQQMEEKRKKELKKKADDEERQRIDEDLKKRVQEAAKRDKQNKDKEIAEKNKQWNAQMIADYKARKSEIIDRARKQPMLVQRVSKRDEKIEKMKKLWQISETLKKNGIRGKEHDHYFKREELLLLEDYKQLKEKL